MPDNLNIYIEEARAKKIPDVKIKETPLSAGWNEDQVNTSLNPKSS